MLFAVVRVISKPIFSNSSFICSLLVITPSDIFSENSVVISSFNSLTGLGVVRSFFINCFLSSKSGLDNPYS